MCRNIKTLFNYNPVGASLRPSICNTGWPCSVGVSPNTAGGSYV